MIELGTESSSRELSLSPFIPNQPLVDDFSEGYYLNVEVDDIQNEYVEARYGPFDNQARGYSTPETYSPRPKSRIDELAKHYQEIENLKRAISEKEKAKQKAEAKPDLIKAADKEIKALISETAETIQHLKEIEQGSLQEQVQVDLVQDDMIKKPLPEETVQEKSVQQEPVQSEPVQREPNHVVYVIDSGSDMDISSDESPPEEDVMTTIANEILDSKPTTDSENVSFKNEMEDNSSRLSKLSFFTANDDFSEDDKLMNELEFEQHIVKTQINDLKKQLRAVDDNDKEINIKLSYLQVRMSMAKNKTASKSNKRPNNFNNNSTPPYKRPQLDLNRSNYSYYQQQQYRQPIASHYQPYHQSYITPPPSSPAYLQHPPPPPSDLPPPLSPPPPPPPVDVKKNRNFRNKSKGAGDNLRVALKTMEHLIATSIFAFKNEYPALKDRHLPRPRRLVTIDDYTMTMNMVFLNKDHETHNQVLQKDQSFLLPAGNPALYTMSELDYESPLFVLLYRKAQNKKFDRQMESAILAILLSIPSDVDLGTFHKMRIHAFKLLNTYDLVCAFNHDYPRNHFLAALKLELSRYVHGPSSLKFQTDFEECIKRIPASVDLYWQYISEESSYAGRLSRFKYALSVLRSTAPNRTKEDLNHLSGMTAELLTRLVRIGGIKDVIKIMTHKDSFEIDTTKADIFKLDTSPDLYLLEEDKYYIWMLVVHYLIMQRLPQGVSDMWMNGLVKDGHPNMSKALFSIDWTDALKDQPLDTETLYGATNILLSMLAHFGELACLDLQKKPLLIGVLRTLMTFLCCVPCYMVPGTLELLYKFQEIQDLSPEILEMLTDLEFKSNGSLKTVITRLFDGCQTLTRPQSFAIAYRSVCMYCEQINYTTENIVLLACMLSIPLASDQTNRSEVEKIILNSVEGIDYEAKVAMVKGILQNYRNLVRRSEADLASTFVWINLLLLQKIYQMLCPVERNDILQEMRNDVRTGRRYLTSYDAQMLLLKYATELVDETD